MKPDHTRPYPPLVWLQLARSYAVQGKWEVSQLCLNAAAAAATRVL